MKFEDVHKWIHGIFPYLCGVFVGLAISFLFCVNSGLPLQETKEIVIAPAFNLSTGEFTAVNQTVFVLSDFGNGVFLPLLYLLLGFVILLFVLIIVELIYRIHRTNGV